MDQSRRRTARLAECPVILRILFDPMFGVASFPARSPSQTSRARLMELDRDQERKTYRHCQIGFGFLSMALLIASVMRLLTLPMFFQGRHWLARLRDSAVWHWADTPIVFGCLIGWYLLLNCWKTRAWQRTTGLLVVMGMVDTVLWLIEHGGELGLKTGVIGHDWFREGLGHALGWAELAMAAGLASEVLIHLGIQQAVETGRTTRTLAASGATVWMLHFFIRTDWQAGWPLLLRPGVREEAILLYVASSLIWTVVLLQVTALTMAATRKCTLVLREMEQEDRANDPFRSASEHGFGSVPDDRF